MDDYALLEGATMTQWQSIESTTLSPFMTTPQMEFEGNATVASVVNMACDSEVHAVNVSEFPYPFRKDTWMEITGREVIKIIAYIVIILVSLGGNVLVILAVYYNANMRTSTNQYLVNLAAADLLVTMVCMWTHIVRHLSHPNYILPVVVCKLEGFVQATTLLASVLTLTVISVGRFVAVRFPFRARTSPDRAHKVIGAVWITSALLACPTLLYRQHYSLQWKDYTSWHCDELWPSEHVFNNETKSCENLFDYKVMFYTVFTIALYFLPVAIMLINYSLVVWRMWVTEMPGEQLGTSRNIATRSKKKVVKMVSVVLVAFVLCWTPLQSIILYNNFVHLQHNSLPEWFPTMEFAAYFIAHSNSALNPIIYCGFNANFRQGILALLRCRHSPSERVYHPRSTFRTTLPTDRSEGTAGNYKPSTAASRDASTGAEPAVLMEFNSSRKNRNGSRSKRLHDSTLETQNNHNGSGSNSGCKRLTQNDSTVKNQVRNSSAIYVHPRLLNSPTNESTDKTPRGMNLKGLSSRSLSPNGVVKKIPKAPLPRLGPKGLVGSCCGKRKDKMKPQLVSKDGQVYATTQYKDNKSSDTKEDML